MNSSHYLAANVRRRTLSLFLKMVLPLLGFYSSAEAQAPTQQVTGPTRPQPVPLSGKNAQSGSVMINEQVTNTSGGNSVNVINSSVNVSAPFNGSVLMGSPPTADILSLSLQMAVRFGLQYNLGVISQNAALQQAQGGRKIARSELLPNLNAGVAEQLERLNLRTQGVETSMFPESVKFNFYDARVRFQQSVFDAVKIQSLRSADQTLKSTLHQVESTRDLVVLAVGGTYMQLVATSARVSAAEAQLATSHAIYEQARDRFQLGLASRIDVSRSQVQFQTEAQRLLSLQADLQRQSLDMARLIGLPMEQKFAAVDDFKFAPLTDWTLEKALQQAESRRPDWKAAVSAVRAAEANVKAARAERLPNLAVNADFGATGITPSHESTGAYTVTGLLTIPIFEGGRISGDTQQAKAALTQRQSELADLRQQIQEDIRKAFIDLNLAADQVGVSQQNVQLARETLTQSRDRFSVGVADTVELVQAEQTSVQADDDYITAIFEYNLAKVALARALGGAEQILPQLLWK
jgi:outer membrane protein TolC